MKTCTKCNTKYKEYGQRNSFCKPCKRIYDREYHASRSAESKLKKQELQAVRRRRIKDKYSKWKEDVGCTRCDENDPVCLDLHHLDPSEKEISLGDAIKRGWGFDRLMKEAAKCIVLCVNCHRKEHS